MHTKSNTDAHVNAYTHRHTHTHIQSIPLLLILWLVFDISGN